MKPITRPYGILLTGSFLWCAIIVFPPLQHFCAWATGPANAIYHSFASICHQMDSRSYHLFGHKFAVCARCTAIYFGFLFGVILAPIVDRRPASHPLVIWLMAVAPMLVDVLLDILSIHNSTIATRTITGGWFGLFAGMMMVPLFAEAFKDLFHSIATDERKLHGSLSK